MKTGIVFDYKEFAVYDGPGVRHTVFLKGCPLRCNWCHNPEGLSAVPQLMVGAGCTGCGACERACHGGTCNACGQCVAACPLRLRKVCGERLSSQELATRILRHNEFYAAHGGGVTFSGGEPLMQTPFLLETASLLPGVHKVLETCGYASESHFCAAVQAMDYVYLDIKLVESTAHKKYTGVDNRLILTNLEQLQRSTIPFSVRVPVIPGVNDTRENYAALAALLAKGRPPERVELLAYHKTAGAKYAMVGRTYRPLFDLDQPCRFYPALFEAQDLRCVVL